MHLTALLSLFGLAYATVLVSYDASAGNPASTLGLANYDCYNDVSCPNGFAGNSSLYFETSTDPNGVAAAHVHKDPHFARAEYHMLNGQTVADTTYYIGYKVRFDAVDYQLIVFQWKDYNGNYVTTDDIPACLVFRANNDDSSVYNNITWAVNPDPSGHSKGGSVWSKELTMGTTYQFGIVINTSVDNGYVQIYFNGRLSTMIDPNTGEHTQQLAGNFFPGGTQGAASPKVGLYGDKHPTSDDSFIYNVVVATTLDEIKSVAGIS